MLLKTSSYPVGATIRGSGPTGRRSLAIESRLTLLVGCSIGAGFLQVVFNLLVQILFLLLKSKQALTEVDDGVAGPFFDILAPREHRKPP